MPDSLTVKLAMIECTLASSCVGACLTAPTSSRVTLACRSHAIHPPRGDVSPVPTAGLCSAHLLITLLLAFAADLVEDAHPFSRGLMPPQALPWP
eukprot:1489675-Pleurochrysis_carterae.AAC.1